MWNHCVDWWRVLNQYSSHYVAPRVTFKRLAAAQHLVKDDPNREYVSAVIYLLTACLLWRHVSGRAHHNAGPSRHWISACTLCRIQLSNPEIKNFYKAVVSNDDV